MNKFEIGDIAKVRNLNPWNEITIVRVHSIPFGGEGSATVETLEGSYIGHRVLVKISPLEALASCAKGED